MLQDGEKSLPILKSPLACLCNLLQNDRTNMAAHKIPINSAKKNHYHQAWHHVWIGHHLPKAKIIFFAMNVID